MKVRAVKEFNKPICNQCFHFPCICGANAYGDLEKVEIVHSKQPYCCPVCGGNGKVPNGFYLITKGCSGMTTNATPDQCK